MESQSRYAIVQQLNERKIKEQEKLAQLQRGLRIETIKHEKGKTALENALGAKKQSYKKDHQNWKKVRELEKEMLIQEHNRGVEKIEAEIAERDKTFEEDHQTWVATKVEELRTNADFWKNFKIEQQAAITDSQAVIKEIENGINSLKEISKNQKE